MVSWKEFVVVGIRTTKKQGDETGDGERERSGICEVNGERQGW